MTPIGLLEILPHQPHTATVVPLFYYGRYRMVTPKFNLGIWQMTQG